MRALEQSGSLKSKTRNESAPSLQVCGGASWKRGIHVRTLSREYNLTAWAAPPTACVNNIRLAYESTQTLPRADAIGRPIILIQEPLFVLPAGVGKTWRGVAVTVVGETQGGDVSVRWQQSLG